MLDMLLRSENLKFVKEHRFHPVRKWLFDYALIDEKIAIEIEGGNFVQGRHTRGVGYEKDCEKYNEAQMCGWIVLRYTTNQLNKNVLKPIEDIKRIIDDKIVITY